MASTDVVIEPDGEGMNPEDEAFDRLTRGLEGRTGLGRGRVGY